MSPRVVSLCSGVGLIDLGLEWAGYRTVQVCEIDEWCRGILTNRFPGADVHDDAWTIDPAPCDVLAAGIPCQPFSLAGKRKGLDDERWLWGAVERVLRLVRPRYLILENVRGFTTHGLGEVLRSLAGLGFDAEWTHFRASDVGALHRRDRFWLVATSDADVSGVWDEHGGFFREGWGASAVAWAHGTPRPVAYPDELRRAQGVGVSTRGVVQGGGHVVGDGAEQDVADTDGERRDRRAGHVREAAGRGEPADGSGRRAAWLPQPGLDRGADGSSRRMDITGGGVDAESEAGPDEVLRALWGATGSQAVQRAYGGPGRVPSQAVLQPDVFGGRICQRCAVRLGPAEAGYAVPWDILRVVWGDSESPRASHRRAAVEQLCREHPDLVRFMSRIPPPPCAACWSDGSWESSLSRVTTRTENRARRLSALGNGVVPQCAELIGLRIRQIDPDV